MPNNIAVSVTADVADLQVKRAIMSAELQTARKDLRDFAKEAQTGGLTDKLRTDMLGAADSVARLGNQVASTDRQIKSLTVSEVEEAVAVEANTGAHISNRAAREALVLVHEALSGNYHRMVGSLMIEAQALSGAEGASKALSAVMSPMGLAIVGTVAVIGAAVAATVMYENEQEKLTATTLGLGAATGLSADQLRTAGDVASEWSGQSVRATTEAAQAFDAAGVRSEHSIEVLSAGIKTYAELTGQKAADAQKALATAMQDPIKGAEDLHNQLHILDGTQLDMIRSLTQAGDKEGAVAIITQAFGERIHEANVAGVGANGTWATMTTRLSDLWSWLGKVGDAMHGVAEEEQAMRNGSYGAFAAARDAADQAKQGATGNIQRQAALVDASAAGKSLREATPEERDQQAKGDLAGKVAVLQKALTADTQLHGAHSAAVAADSQALAEYKRAFDSYIPSAQKAHEISQLDAQISEAKRKHDKEAVESLTKQKEMLNLSGQVMSTGEASQRASDAADKGGATTGGGGKGPGAVAEWEQQLHQQEVASGEFFKDQTASELAFWQGKLALTKSGSKDWLEIQSKIYDAEKSLARDDYQAHLADLNERMESDRNSWAKEQADWNEKLAYIAGKMGEESAEYKNAYREMERAQREHNDEMFRQEQEAAKKSLDNLKKQTDDARKAREDQAKGNEQAIRAKGGSSPFGDVEADIKIGALHAQLIQQEMGDLAQLHDAQDTGLNAQIEKARATYSEDSNQYRAAVQAKLEADRAYAEQRQVLDAKMRTQSIQDILAVQQSYHIYVDGMVSSGVTGIDQLISKQKSWQQVGIGIYQTLVRQFEAQISKMVSTWIVQHVLMTSAQRAQLAVQQGQQVAANATSTAAAVASAKTQALALVGLAGAGGVASMAAAPFPMDLGAPAFGASMAAAAGSMAAFDKGTNMLPNDMIAQVHAGERIVPKADNDTLIDLTRRGAQGGGDQGKGDSHFHYNPIVNGQMPFAEQLAAHEDNIISMFHTARRNGRI